LAITFWPLAARVFTSTASRSANDRDSAPLLVEKVIPEVPIRQWVCSLPWRLRMHLGYDRDLCADVLEAFVVEVSRALKRRAKGVLGLKSLAAALTGAVSVIQAARQARPRCSRTADDGASSAWAAQVRILERA